MHECPACQRVCDCDQDDLWNDAHAKYCSHDCADENEDLDDFEDELDELDYPSRDVASKESKE
jgi:hypothetical protein